MTSLIFSSLLLVVLVLGTCLCNVGLTLLHSSESDLPFAGTSFSSIVHGELTINYVNNCDHTLWLSANPSIDEGEATLTAGSTEMFYSPDVWGGTLWARTNCVSNASYYLMCDTGDCGSGAESCQGLPPHPPVTSVNLVINQNFVTYEVSLNKGHNVPVRVSPGGGKLPDGTAPCPVMDCIADISNVCPADLVQYDSGGKYVGCNSPCDKLRGDEYCCTGIFSGPNCKPNKYSTRFKELCGLAHTYPGDNTPPIYKCQDPTSIDIIFCPL